MKKIFCSIFTFFCLFGCSEKQEINSQFLGTWRLEARKGIHTILALRNNGSFEIDLRIEGRLSKVVEKRGKATGTWLVNKEQTQFTLTTIEGDPEIGWPAGTKTYHISKMDGLMLHLHGRDGRTIIWQKVRRLKKGEEAELGSTTISMAPIVVNLQKSTKKSHQKYKWLCAKIDIHLNGSAPAGGIHPKVNDKILLLLSAKTYGEVNTKAKIESITQELKDLINPYMNRQVAEVSFRNIIVTGNKNAVVDFTEKDD